jgi:hypothetical protein
MELLAECLEGRTEDQQIEDLVPLCLLSLNPNVCGLCHCLGAGYSDKDFPLEETIFLETWNINSLKD